MLREALWDTVLYVDTDGLVNKCSPGISDLLGYLPEEVNGFRLESLIHSSSIEAFWKGLKQVLNEGQPTRAELMMIRNDGTLIDLRAGFTTAATPEGESGMVVCALKDITEERRLSLQESALELQVQRRQRQESLIVLAGRMTHDINGIMSVVLLNAKLALKDLPEDHEVVPPLKRILSAVARSQQSTRQMLAFTGNGYFNLEMIDIGGVLRSMCDMVKASFPDSISFKCEIDTDMPTIKADPIQLGQLVMNLVKNAYEALNNSSGAINVTAGMTKSNDNILANAYYSSGQVSENCILLEIADTGCGMSEEDLTKIFDPYFTTKFKGRGLGLTVVLGVVRTHSATIAVDSALGIGTTFRVCFPICLE